MPPPVASSTTSAEPEVAPEAPPTTFAAVNAILARAEREPEAERKKSYALARSALTSLTREPGRPAILSTVRTERGREETRLVPQNRRRETARWGALTVAGERVVKVGDRVVSLDAGRITIWGAEPVRIDARGANALSVPEGETRFVLASGKDTAFVVDSETGKALLASPASGAMLWRTKNGEARFAHLRSDKETTYEVSELPSGKTRASWRRLVAAEVARRVVAVVRTPAAKPSSLELAVVLPEEADMVARTIPNEERFAALDGVRVSPDFRSIAFVEKGEARWLHLDTGKEELLKRLPSGARSSDAVVFDVDGRQVCVGAPGDMFPRGRGVPGTSQRCYVADGVARVANLAAPPIGFRRAERDPGSPSQTYEIMSPGGALVAAILHDGTPATAKRFTVAVYDAATGKQLWNQFLDSMKSLASPPSLAFSDDAVELVVDGVRLESRTGVAVDDKPVDSESLTPLMKRFGLNVGGKTLSLMRLGYDVPFFQAGQLVWTVDLAPRPLSIILDPVTLTMALRGHGSKQSIVFASGPTSALAFLPDGSFAKSGEGSDLVCELGSVLAPIEVCQSKQEIPALRVPAALGDLSR